MWFTVIFWTLVALGVLGIGVDVMAIRAKRLRGVAWTSVALKGVAAIVTVGYVLALQAGAVPVRDGWSDLVGLAMVLVAATATLSVTLLLDVILTVSYLRNH